MPGEPIWEKFYNALEDRVVRLERDIAVREETLRNIESRLKSIEGILSKLTWVIVTAVLLGALSFVVRNYVGH